MQIKNIAGWLLQGWNCQLGWGGGENASYKSDQPVFSPHHYAKHKKRPFAIDVAWSVDIYPFVIEEITPISWRVQLWGHIYLLQ